MLSRCLFVLMLVVAVGLHVLHFGPRSFAFVNVALVLVWILLNVGIAREHRKLVPDDPGGTSQP